MRLYRLVGADDAVPACDQSCEVMLRTQPIPAKLLLSRDLHAIAERVPLSTGGAFRVDAHDTWFTEDEVGDLLSGRPVRWLGGRMPKLAPY